MTQTLESMIPGSVYSRPDCGIPATPGGSRREPRNVIGFTQHWTTGNALGVSNTRRWWKNIYDYHVGHNGWADIGYAFGVDRFGNVFFGRGRYRQLAHARGYNTTWLGVAYMGGHDSHVTPEGQIALRSLHDWLRAEGEMSNMRDRNGHRDLGSTACPGNLLHSWVHNGMPLPKVGAPQPDNGQPDRKELDHLIVAVVANNPVDEGMARVLGRYYQWRFLTIGYDAPESDRVENYRIDTAVRVGAAANESNSAWENTRDVAGGDRNATATKVVHRIREDDYDSRTVW